MSGNSGKGKSYAENLTNSEFELLTDKVFWVSVETEALDSEFINDTDTLTFASPKFARGISSRGEVRGVDAYFDLDGGSDGSINPLSGALEVCVGASSIDACGKSGSAIYKVNFSGDAESGFLSVDDISDAYVYVNGSNVPDNTNLTGSISGIFTGVDHDNGLYDAFVGGFNFVDSPGSPTEFLTGTFVLERDDQLNSTQIKMIDHTQRALVLDPEHESIAFMDHYLSDDEVTRLFIGDRFANGVDYEDFLAGNVVIANRIIGEDSSGGSEYGYEYSYSVGDDVLWGYWEYPETLTANLRKNLDETAQINLAASEQRDSPIYWSVFTPSATYKSNLIARYSVYDNLSYERYDFEGSDEINTYLSLNMFFDVDFYSGSISNGEMTIYGSGEFTSGKQWQLYGFSGNISGSTINFDFEKDEINNNYGYYTSDDIFDDFEPSGQSAINVAVMKTTLTLDSSEGIRNAILGSYHFATSDDVESISGLFHSANTYNNYTIDMRLVEYLYDEDKNRIVYEDEVVDLDHSLNSFGFIMPTDKHNLNINEAPADYLYFAYTNEVNSETDPVFATVYGPDYFNYNADEYREDYYGAFPLVFKRGDADLTNSSFASSELDLKNIYGVSWGIWDSVEGSAIAYSDESDLEYYDDDFNKLVWTAFNDIELNEPSGVYTYARTRDFIGAASNGEITDVFASFDVDFYSAGISATYLRICVGGGIACSGGSLWETTSVPDIALGDIHNGFIPYTLVSGLVTLDEEITSFDGKFNGRFLSGVSDSSKLDAFLGAFNFYEYEYINDDKTYSNNFVTGVFLTEREERYQRGADSASANLIKSIESSEYVGMLVSAQTTGTSIAFGKANPAGTGPTLTHNGFDQLITDPDFLSFPAASVVVATSDESYQHKDDFGIAGASLEWGRWDSGEVMSALTGLIEQYRLP